MHEDRTCVGIFIRHRGYDCPCSEHPDRKDGALVHVIPANGTKRSVFGPPNFPRCRRGSYPGPLAPEASALTTELLRLDLYSLIGLLQIDILSNDILIRSRSHLKKCLK